MAIPHGALVLVADGKKMLFLRNHGDKGLLDLRTESHEARKDKKDRELKTDAPGTQAQSMGYGRPTMEETDFHQQEEDRWVKEAERRIILTVNKEMTDRPIPDIEELLVGEGAPPA